MQHESGIAGETGLNGKSDCPFCRHESIPYILKETPHFLLATDHAPLVDVVEAAMRLRASESMLP